MIMDKTIENKLFTEFQNGAASMCLEYVNSVIANNGKNLDDIERNYYSAFPSEIAKRTESFDDSAWPVNVVGEYRIAQEISDNLDSCANENQRERYVIEILSVFEKWGEIFTPVARLERLKNMIGNELSFYSDEDVKQEIERVKGLHDKYLDIMRGAEKGTMEYYLSFWHRAFYMFVKMLAAICAEHHINLLEIQAKRGIWLIEKLDVVEMQSYFGYNGDFTYANSILKSLPRTDVTEALILTEKDGAINSEAAWNNNNYEPAIASVASDLEILPRELASEKALKYIPIAIDRGLIERTKKIYLWKGKSKVLLELFFGIIYCGDNIKPSRRCKDEWHLGIEDLPSVALSRLFPAIKNIGQQRVNNLITSHKGVRYRTAPKGWETIIEIFDHT